MPGMDPRDGSTFIAALTTIGRVTGREHTRMLKAVRHNGRIYFSRHRPDSDWFKNVAKNPAVTVQIGGQRFEGNASVVTDEGLARKISELKYPGEERAKEMRVAVEVSLCGPP